MQVRSDRQKDLILKGLDVDVGYIITAHKKVLPDLQSVKLVRQCHKCIYYTPEAHFTTVGNLSNSTIKGDLMP